MLFLENFKNVIKTSIYSSFFEKMKWKCLDDFIVLSSGNDNEIVDDIDRFIELFYSLFNLTKLTYNIK